MTVHGQLGFLRKIQLPAPGGAFARSLQVFLGQWVVLDFRVFGLSRLGFWRVVTRGKNRGFLPPDSWWRAGWGRASVSPARLTRQGVGEANRCPSSESGGLASGADMKRWSPLR